MKLPDFLKFEPLNVLKRRMGIPDDVYGSPIPLNMPTKEELDECILVNFTDLTILPDATFALKDRRILLYIRYVHVYGRQEFEPRYHLFNCTAIIRMNGMGRFARYVAFDKATPEFDLNITKNNITTTERRKLSVCKNCLAGLSFKGFHLQMPKAVKKRFVAEFMPDHFFELYPRSLHIMKPKYDSDTAPRNEYPPDWKEISERLRRANGWQCQKCRQILSEPRVRQYLHVHHVDGNRSNNTPQNLKILCKACHAKEPQHSHMRNAPAYAEYNKLNPTRRNRQSDAF